MKVKICGIAELEPAIVAIENGADALGFVFAPSRRKIDARQAADIIKHLPKEILKVGVFVNETIEKIETIIQEANLNIVQLHGDETPSFCEQLSVPVIKAISIEAKEDINKIHQYNCDYILVDSPVGKYRGGNGVTFDWSLVSNLKNNNKKIILAGGLTKDNVLEGIKYVHPFMVDVSSGVESNGKKDLEKIKSFIKVAKQAIKEEK